MIVYWGQIAGSKPAKYRVKVNAPNARAAQECGSEQAAKALARQLAGGRVDRVKRTTFPAAKAAAALAAPSRADDAAAELAAAELAAAELAAAELAAAELAAAELAAAELAEGSAKAAALALADGAWDDHLDVIEAAEQAREGGARVTVTRAIEKRRAAG